MAPAVPPEKPPPFHPQDLHKAHESRISFFHDSQDTIPYPSCFDAIQLVNHDCFWVTMIALSQSPSPSPQDLHKALESRISSFHGTQDTILYPSCFDANAGLFEALLGPQDAVISDELNHASIIDGIRLCKAKRFRWGRGAGGGGGGGRAGRGGGGAGGQGGAGGG